MFTHATPPVEFKEFKRKNIEGLGFYEINGKNYPSVTTVLSVNSSEGIARWRQNVGEEVADKEMQRAAIRGKQLHLLVENHLNNKEGYATKYVLPIGLFHNMKPYLNKIDNIVGLEKVLYSTKYGAAGRVDCIAEYEGKLSIIDFKSANKEKKEEWIENYYLQCTAYAKMYEEMSGQSINNIVVLIAGEDGSMNVFQKNPNDYEQKFVDTLHKFYKSVEEKYPEYKTQQ